MTVYFARNAVASNDGGSMNNQDKPATATEVDEPVRKVGVVVWGAQEPDGVKQ